jgi:hypothetical protein
MPKNALAAQESKITTKEMGSLDSELRELH